MNENPTNADEQYELGNKYKSGDGVPKDWEMAKYWYAKAAEQGSLSGSFALNRCKFEEGLVATKRRGAGNDASVKLVEDALDQLHNKNNVKKATALFEKAAKKGHMGAQFVLGETYEKGCGVAQSMYAAIDWYTKAAEQGHPEAQNCLGNLYYNGIYKGVGVPQDKTKAKYWFSKAAEQGNKAAINSLNKFNL